MDIIILGLGIFSIFFCLGMWLRERYYGKTRSAQKESVYQKPVSVHRSKMLDNDEVRNLGKEAAQWCSTWMNDSSADHKWLVIEISTDKMDCRSVYGKAPYSGYPHCTIQYSKTISQESRSELVQKILSIIESECPEMIFMYGLYKDGNCLILPTNFE